MAVSKPLLHPPLVEVAFEISFSRQFLVENRIAEYQKKVSEAYPNSSDEFVVRLPPVVAFGKSPKPDTPGLTPVRSFVFQNSDRSRSIKVSVVNLNFLVRDYKDFADYKKELLNVLMSGIEIFELQRIERMGLRYINKISVPNETGALGYQDYVHPVVDLSIFSGKQVLNFLTEIRLELDENKSFTIRSGLLPGEPSANSRTYLLDFDCYSEKVITVTEQDLLTILEEYHETIEREFTQLPTEKYWNYMAEGGPM